VDQAFLGLGLGLGMVGLFLGLSLGMAWLEHLAQSNRWLIRGNPYRDLAAVRADPAGPEPSGDEHEQKASLDRVTDQATAA
jgi:hypothetical protein